MGIIGCLGPTMNKMGCWLEYLSVWMFINWY